MPRTLAPPLASLREPLPRWSPLLRLATTAGFAACVAGTLLGSLHAEWTGSAAATLLATACALGAVTALGLHHAVRRDSDLPARVEAGPRLASRR